MKFVLASSKSSLEVDLLAKFSDATGAAMVAEGVETEGEAAVLRKCGAHLLQGYLFHKPTIGLPGDLSVVAG